MEAERNSGATLVDLLDRVLDKGLVLQADLIISVAGIPLLGLKLHAALAGIETMLEYGMWEQWDEAHRIAARKEYLSKNEAYLSGSDEKTHYEGFASILENDGISEIYRPAKVIITSTRLILLRNQPFEILCDIPIIEIRGINQERKMNNSGEWTDHLSISFHSQNGCVLHMADSEDFLDAIGTINPVEVATTAEELQCK